MQQYDGRLQVAGRRVQGATQYEITDPYRDTSLATIHVASEEQVDEAAETAWTAGRVALKSLAVHRRVEILRRAISIIRERRTELAQTISRQTGKALRDSLREIDRSTYTVTAAATAAESLTGELLPADAIPGGEGLWAIVVREPVGVVAAITPFNAPFNLPMHKVAAALVAGNPVILKPAPQAPLSGHQLADVFREAGLPDAALQVVTGGAEVGAALVSHDKVTCVSFTGGTAAGAAIAATAGIKRLVLELGGNSPNVVHLDADVSWATEALVAGAFSNTGQSCNSVQRVLAHESIAEELANTLATAASQLKVGDPLDASTEVGTLVAEDQARRVKDWIDDAIDGGAQLLAGGDKHGAALTPTVLSRVEAHMRVACEEVFGPVLVLLTYKELDDAIELANATPFGLQSAIFTSSLETAFRFARAVESGGVMVNRSSNTRLDHSPFGGVKASGMGREGGRFSIDEFTQSKLVLIDPEQSGIPHPLSRPRSDKSTNQAP